MHVMARRDRPRDMLLSGKNVTTGPNLVRIVFYTYTYISA